MFCNQCEQTRRNKGCTTRGVCGKTPEAAALQDLLTHALKSLAIRARIADEEGSLDDQTRRFIMEALFATLTNVNFDPARLESYMREALARRDRLAADQAGIPIYDPVLFLELADSMEELVQQGTDLGLPFQEESNPDLRSLQEITLYGIRGLAAYAYHAALLGMEDDRVYSYVISALADLGQGELGMDAWLGLAFKCGEINLQAMELLDAAHTETFGHPVPTSVPLGAKAGPAILVSGHDLKDLHQLLEATAGQGINIYTHGEMLPAHGYPRLKAYPHLYGNYGGAWQNQKKEFAAFPGPILMTTNCIQKPAESYAGSIYTAGPVGWPGVSHLDAGDYQPLIDQALAMPGFPSHMEAGSVTVGFGRQAMLNVAGPLIEAIKSGALRHIFLVGGCDGAKAGRSYFTDFVDMTPPDTAVLTLGCGKYRFYDHDLGTVAGLPRLLDMGQCNDAYSAIHVALALAEALECPVNDLPLSLVLSWYEQKAVAILLTLLNLEISGIRLGPSLPAFLSPGVLDFLVANFNLKAVGEAGADLADILGAEAPNPSGSIRSGGQIL